MTIKPNTETEKVIHFLMNQDFTKHVDILSFLNLPGFHLTEEEKEVKLRSIDLLKIVKIMLYKF